jgi:hypothetical protein
MSTVTQTQTCTWTGESGRGYTYHVHALPISFNAGQLGNYIYSKLNANDQWVPIYIGQGDLGDRVSDSHHKAQCIKAKSATHVHVHLSATKKAAETEEADLLGYYANAFEPHGCNEASGL